MHGFRSIYHHLLDHFPLSGHGSRHDTISVVFDGVFGSGSYHGWALVWSCLDSTMIWKRNLMSPWQASSLRQQRFWAKQSTYIYNSTHHGFCCISRALMFLSLVVSPLSTFVSFLIIASLPRPYLQLSEIPPPCTERHFGNGCRGSRALSAASRARRVVVTQRRAGKGGEAGQIGRGRTFSRKGQ